MPPPFVPPPELNISKDLDAHTGDGTTIRTIGGTVRGLHILKDRLGSVQVRLVPRHIVHSDPRQRPPALVIIIANTVST